MSKFTTLPSSQAEVSGFMDAVAKDASTPEEAARIREQARHACFLMTMFLMVAHSPDVGYRWPDGEESYFTGIRPKTAEERA